MALPGVGPILFGGGPFSGAVQFYFGSGQLFPEPDQFVVNMEPSVEQKVTVQFLAGESNFSKTMQNTSFTLAENWLGKLAREIGLALSGSLFGLGSWLAVGSCDWLGGWLADCLAGWVATRANFYREANFETEANFRRKSNFSSEANFRPEANFCNEANFGRPIMTLAPGPGAGNSPAPYLGPGPPGAE